MFTNKPKNRKDEIMQSVLFVIEWLIVGGGLLKFVSFGLDLLGVK